MPRDIFGTYGNPGRNSSWGFLTGRRQERLSLLSTAVACARAGWPLVPGAGLHRWSRLCRCGREDCTVPGVHPFEPPLLAASADERMVRWWWARSPDAPVVLATGTKVAALSVPAEAGRGALDELDLLGVRTGPVMAAPGRYTFLTQAYSFDVLGDLLDRYGLDRYGMVPNELRFHGPDGYLAIPPSRTPRSTLTWLRAPEAPDRPIIGTAADPVPFAGTPYLPPVADLVSTLVDTCHHVTTAGGRSPW
jgi:hypothetical protein